MTQQLPSKPSTLAWENRANISADAAPRRSREAVEHVIAELNAGTLRVAERQGVGQWTVQPVDQEGGAAVASA